MRENLARLGYTSREAEFLWLAALLSGYFVRRQFNEFLGRECGALAQRFIERAVRLSHVKELPALGNRLIYHVCGSAIYGALGETANRNRREHRPDTVRRRLMALDFAIGRRERVWLLTERAKVDYFGKLAVPERDLPGADFGSKAERFFIDRQPISLGEEESPEFAFIDEGLRTLSQWELFLKAHRALFNQLEGAALVYAGCDPERFLAAENLFRRTVAGETATGGLDLDRLRKYFSSRKLFDAKRYDTFDQPRLDELREAKRVFAGQYFDNLYGNWCEHGDAALSGLRPPRAVFSTWHLPHFYEWLSPIRIPERRAAHAHYSVPTEKNT